MGKIEGTDIRGIYGSEITAAHCFAEGEHSVSAVLSIRGAGRKSRIPREGNTYYFACIRKEGF
jgi:hypothetical protein